MGLELGLCFDHHIRLQKHVFTALSGVYQHHTNALTYHYIGVKIGRDAFVNLSLFIIYRSQNRQRFFWCFFSFYYVESEVGRTVHAKKCVAFSICIITCEGFRDLRVSEKDTGNLVYTPPKRLLPTRCGSVASGRFPDIYSKNRYLKTRSAQGLFLFSENQNLFGERDQINAKYFRRRKLGPFLVSHFMHFHIA